MQPINHRHADFQSGVRPLKALYFNRLSVIYCPLGATVHDVEHSPKATPVVRKKAMKSMQANTQEGQATFMR